MTTTTTSNITAIVLEVQKQIRSLIEYDIRLAPKFLRLAFHDAVSLNCLDMNNPENLGLGYPIAALDPIVQSYDGVFSQADIWVTAALVACEVTSTSTSSSTSSSSSSSPDDNFFKFPMYYYGRTGRGVQTTPIENSDEASDGTSTTDEDGCRNVVPRPFPAADLTTHTLLQYFDEHFNFNARETVVVMGAHTLGQMARNHSGFQDGSSWVDQRHVLNNEYYKLLVGGGRSSTLHYKVNDAKFWSKEFLNNEGISSIAGGRVPNRFMWTRRGRATEEGGDEEKPLIMTNADIALVRDLETELDADGSGKVKCGFAVQDDMPEPVHGRCPAAKETIHLMSEFKYNNTLWLVEFEHVLRKMFMYGYTVSPSGETGNDCGGPRCLRLVNPNIAPPETDAPTNAPTLVPTKSPTSIPGALTFRPTTTSPIVTPSSSSLVRTSLSMTMMIIIAFCGVFGISMIIFGILTLRHKRRSNQKDSEVRSINNSEMAGTSKVKDTPSKGECFAENQ